MLFFFGKTVFLFAECNTLHQKGHVFGQDTQGLKAFQVLLGLTFSPAVQAVPVLTGGNRHSADGEVLVQYVEGSGVAGSPGADDRRADLHVL